MRAPFCWQPGHVSLSFCTIFFVPVHMSHSSWMLCWMSTVSTGRSAMQQVALHVAAPVCNANLSGALVGAFKICCDKEMLY